MLISTIIFNDGEERQFRAEILSIGSPSEVLARVDLGNNNELIIPLTSIKLISTEDLPEDAISPEVFNENVPS